jgi:guanine deaminase
MDKQKLQQVVKENIDIIQKDLNVYGGPFGAVVVDNDCNIVGVGWNTVTGSKDPTAHAEVNAIRNACKHLGTYDLTGYSIIATGYPCPMCLSAIMWANIKDVYFVADVEEAERIGFRDDFIYDTIKLLRSGATQLKAIHIKKLNIKDQEKRMSELYTKYQQEGQMY